MQNLTLVALVLSVLAMGCGITEAKGWKQKEFIITMWCAPPATDENLSVLVRDNYTLTNVSFLADGVVSAEDPVKLLDVAQKHGIKSMIYNQIIWPDSLNDPAKKAQLDALIDKVKDHPAFAGYHIRDEPPASDFPGLAKLVKYLKERDPKHLAYINLYPSYANQKQLAVFLTEEPKGPVGIPDNFAGVGTNKQTIQFYNEHLRLYVEQIKPELISYDHYHFLKDGKNGGQYFLNLALIRQAALKANVPFLNIIQACTIEPSWRLPNKYELRWLAFATIAYGGRGISWFLYWGPKHYGGLYQDGTRMPIADEVAAINKDVLPIGNEMLKMESTAVYNTGVLPVGTEAVPESSPVKVAEGDFVIGLFKLNGVQNVFMVMNRDYKKIATAKLTLEYGEGKLMEFLPAQRKWVYVQPVQSGIAVPIILNEGDGRLFKVVK